MFLKAPTLLGYTYSFDEAREARDKGQILTIRLETSLFCDLRCKYCCNRSGKALKNEISFEKIIALVEEAKNLGAKSIIVIGGGEPTIYPKFYELIKYINAQGLIPVVFTNTQSMSISKARFLYENNTSVIIKLDSLDEKTQDFLVGVKGAYKKIQEGLKNLIDVGYTKTNKDGVLRLGASFVVNKKNMHEVGEIRKFCRKNNIFPNLEMMVPNGNATDLGDIILTKEDWKNVKTNTLKIDQEEFGYDWLPYTPLLGSGCFQPLYNLYITVQGVARPCSSIHCHQVNVYENTLQEIIEKPFFKLARNIDKYLTGKCFNCKFKKLCIGCRGLAFSVAKNNGESDFNAICAEDPSCFL